MAVITVGHEDDVLPGGALRVIAEGTPIAIFNVHGELYAIADTCTHEEFSLADGEMVDDYTVECALHGAQFDIRTGRALCLPATLPEDTSPVWIDACALKIALPD